MNLLNATLKDFEDLKYNIAGFDSYSLAVLWGL